MTRALRARRVPGPSSPPPSEDGKARLSAQPVELSNADEYRLYHSDYVAWCQYAAPRWIHLLSRSADSIRMHWPIATADLKRAIWAQASVELRAKIRAEMGES